ncbi:hypothetical protein GW889_01610 [Candidatus Berkelbacteria bacterium]|nr:hypothetical protein [Candidatus Berkelbacteria bacterium]
MTHKDYMNSLRDGVVWEFRLSPVTIFTLQGHRKRCIHEFIIPPTPSAAFLIHGKKSQELVACYRSEFGILACSHALWGEDSGETFVVRILGDVGYEKTLAILIYRIAMDYPYITGAGTLFTPVPVWIPLVGMPWNTLLAKVQKHLEPLRPAFGRDTFLPTEDEFDYFRVNELSMPGWSETDE